MSYSYSRVSLCNECPFHYKLKYIDKLEPKPDLRANNALFLGTAAHEGIEKRSVEAAIASYLSNYKDLKDIDINNKIEILKLENILPKAIRDVPEGEYEYKLTNPDGFVGYIDLLVKVDEGVYDIYDFKYSNNVSGYTKSPQVHIYKYFYEKLTGNKVRNLYYVMIPKSTVKLNENINQEDLENTVVKIKEELANKEVSFEKIEYNEQLVNVFLNNRDIMFERDRNKIYEKTYSLNCKWCEFAKYCKTNGKDTSELLVKDEYKEVDLFNDESGVKL